MPNLSGRGWWRALGPVGRVLGFVALFGVFSSAALLGVLLHIDLPVGRRLTARAIASFLSNTFQGRITIGSLDVLTPYSLTARDLAVYDVYGKNVLKLDEVRAKANLPDILREIVFGGDRITIVIPHVRVERAETQIITDETSGEPTIVRAFTLQPSAPDPPGPRPAARQVRVWMPVIELGRAYGRGNIGGSPTLEAELAAVRGSVFVSPRGAAVDVSRFGMIVRGVGGTDATGTGTVHIRAPGPIWWTFDGHFGEVGVGTFMRVDGDQMTITADVPRARPAEMRALFADWPIQEDVSGHVEATGELPVLQTSGSFEIGDSRLTANGPLRLSGNVGINLDARGRNVDIRAIWPDAPKTHVDVDAALSIWNKNGRVVVDVNGTTQPTEIAKQPVPAIDVTGTYTDKIFEGKATLHEHGMPTKVAFTVQPDGAIDFDARARRFSIQGAPRLRPYTAMRGQLDVQLAGRIQKNRLDARVTADVGAIELGDLTLQSGHLTGRASGPVDDPAKLYVDAKLAGQNIKSGRFSFERVRASARGPVLTPLVTASLDDKVGPSVEAKATVIARGGPRLSNLELAVKRDDVTLEGKVGSVDLAGGNIEIKDLHLAGAGGKLDGWIRLRRNLLEAKLEGEELDLEVIGRTLGVPRGWAGGKVRVSVDVSAGRDVQRGRVFLALGNGMIAGISGVSLRLNADLEAEKVTGDLAGQVENVGAFGATWDTTLGGHVSDPTAWRDLIGKVDVQLDRVELGNLVYFLPEGARIEELRGHGYARLSFERHIPAALPSLAVHSAGTTGLEVIASPEDAENSRPLRIKDIDLQLTGSISGETGATSTTTLLYYQGEALASASASIFLDLQRLVRAPETLADQLTDRPLNAVLVIPDQNLDRLPKEIRPEAFTGIVGGRFALSGTLKEPTIGLTADAKNLAVVGSRYTQPINMQANAQYEKTSGRFTVQAEVFQNRQRAALFTSSGQTQWADLIGKPRADKPLWTGGAELLLEGLPIQILPPLANNRVAGRTYGTLVMQRHDLLPHVAANIEIRETTIDLVSVGTGKLNLRSDGKLLNTSLRFASAHGTFDAKLLAALSWQGVVPKVDDSRPIRAEVSAKSFDAVLLHPMLSDILSELQGRIDAELKAELENRPDPKKPEQRIWSADIRGNASMRKGIVEISTLGLELRDVNLNATARNVGRGTQIKISDLTARSRSDRHNLSGSATLDMDGLLLSRGKANVNITRSMPVLVQGVAQAYVTGIARVDLERKPEHMLVTVKFDKLTAQLPRAASRSLVTLDDNDDILVLQPLREPILEHNPERTPWVIAFDLAGNVVVQRADLTVPVSGRAELHIDQQVLVKGIIILNSQRKKGRVQLFGKTFEVDRGEIAFDTGENDNPHVDITASTRTPDGTIIFVDVQGRLKEVEVRFRSDPPRANAFELLLGGPSEGEDSSNSAVAGGVGAVGGVAFQELFGNTPLSSVVEFRTGTSESSDKSSYTAAVKLSEKIWFEGTYRLRDVNQSSNSPNAEPPDLSGTIDWKFRPRWSVRTEVGTLGAGLDLLWQYRY